MQSVGTPSIVPGGTQNVLFSGFKAGEQVNLTLFSAPVTLSPVTADGTGVANVSFVVPADSEVGTHRLEAIGQQSGTTGVATFQVIAPPRVLQPDTDAVTDPVTHPDAVADQQQRGRQQQRPGIVQRGDVQQRGRRDRRGQRQQPLVAVADPGHRGGRRDRHRHRGLPAQSAGATRAGRAGHRRRGRPEQAAGPPVDPYADAPTVFLPPVPPGPGGPPPGADPYGLLSGRDHPDSPTLYSGDPAGPTEVIGQGPGRPPYGQPLGQGGPAQGYGPNPGYSPPPAFGGTARRSRRRAAHRGAAAHRAAAPGGPLPDPVVRTAPAPRPGHRTSTTPTPVEQRRFR